MKFSRLRLSGFKSFVEPSELIIQDGLTGVVGPNGCGKSNLLEALRWVMGENSYKNMRASGMDDVIFSGTSSRPARNMAEVTLTLENTDKNAPAQFNEFDTLDVGRRIEREAGSAYRINGKDVRARDVQLLFADASTGARSPALVRQGQIGELINAKPQARRRILEEAAGITGLYTRRHEAELKLKAAETNLTRLDDVVAQLENQLQGLKRQARQAIRYRELSADIRRLEATGLWHDWREASQALEAEQKSLQDVTLLLAGFTRAVSEKTRARDSANEALPALRENEAVRAAVLQRVTLEREGLEKEQQSAQHRQQELKTRLAQIEADLDREREILKDTDSVFSRLDQEEQDLSAATSDQSAAQNQAASELQAAAETLAQAQEKADGAAQRLSELSAGREASKRNLDERERQLAQTEHELEQVTTKHQTLLAASKAEEQQQALEAEINQAQARAETAEDHANAAEASVAAAREAETRARQDFDTKRRAHDALTTEMRTLSKVLNVTEGNLWPPVIDALRVQPGYETALGAALGDDLDAPTDEAAPVHWRELKTMAPNQKLPGNARPLSQFVKAPMALRRRLDQTGLVQEPDAGRLQADLHPGQRLVTMEGGLWRWDGFTAAADAPTAAANRLAERNRLEALEEDARRAGEDAADALKAHETAKQHLANQIEAEKAKRHAWRQAQTQTDAARKALASFNQAMGAKMRELSALSEASRRLNAATQDHREAIAVLKSALEAMPQEQGLAQEVDGLRETLEHHRQVYTDARARHDGLAREIKLRAERLGAIARERAQWISRTQKAQSQRDALQRRHTDTSSALVDMQNTPDAFETRRKKLMSTLQQAEAGKAEAGDRLAEGETAARQAEQALKEAETQLGQTREEIARLTARREAAEERRRDCAARIHERLECKPDQIIETAGLDAENLPDREFAENKLAKLRDQRERLGGVNLRAEVEAAEVETHLTGLVSERDDLIQAINKLRHGIGMINGEGRQRLLEAFDKVNASFGDLFATLFDGGQAELQLVESDDPLEAGLEIMANPPGKRPQTLSLLSGGEQALTAMALIFAVFLTNPSPICVLDEVDAPLDDHNVERFCNLLEAMLEKADTRFLIITHHPLTMARMNRLFGVTMMEKGISQLVSVDLETAESLREAS